MTASQKQAQSKAAADKLGTSLARGGKAKGGLITKPTKTTAKTKGLGGKQ